MPLPLALIGGSLALTGTYSFLQNRIGISNKKTKATKTLPPSVDTRPQMTTVEQRQQEMKQNEAKTNRDLKVSLLAIGSSSFAAVIYPPLLFVSVPLTLYGFISVFKDTLHSWYKKKKICSSAVDLVAIMGALLAHYYFAASFINGMYFIGKKLLLETEDRSNKKMLSQFDRHPQSVWLWTKGIEIEVPFEQVSVGEIIVIHAGETVPFDGQVVQGKISVDQHVLTGEPQPQEKNNGDTVFANTLLVHGNAHIKVTKTGKDTVSAQIGEVLHNTVDFNTTVEARSTKAGNHMTLPTLLMGAIALRTIGLRGAVAVVNSNFSDIARITVPLGVLNHLQQLAKNGILVKDGRAMETLSQVDTIVFDKATLSQEEPIVSKIHTLDQYEENEILVLAASAEHQRTHPIARAIQQSAKQKKLAFKSVEQAEYKSKYGVRVIIQEQNILLGSLHFISREGVVVSESNDWEAPNSEEVHSRVYLAVNGKLAGVIDLQNPIHSETPQLLKTLHKRGLKLCLLSRNNEQSTHKLAESLGIDDYFAESLPHDKGKHIEELQAKGRKVCFIGDGVNDAVAMKKAEVGVSLAGATTVATDTANIVLLNKSLNQLDTLFTASRKFERTFKTNLAGALLPGIASMGAVFLFGMNIYGVITLYTLSLTIGTTNAAVPLVRHHLRHKKKKRTKNKKH